MCKIFLSIIFLLTALQYSGAQSDSTISANQILKIEQALNDALPGDSATWSKYLDPKWHIVTEDGSGLFKNEFLKTFSTFPTGVSGNISVINPVFSFHGNIAVVHYVADEHEEFYGQKLHTTYGMADTWYKTDTSWMMLSMEEFEIPQVPPAIRVDSNTLKLYIGTYTLAHKNLAVISVKSDTLFLQKNNRPIQALLPETNNIFFSKNDARGRKLFVKDKAGKMLMLERRNGQDLIWKRAK